MSEIRDKARNDAFCIFAEKEKELGSRGALIAWAEAFSNRALELERHIKIRSNELEDAR